MTAREREVRAAEGGALQLRDGTAEAGWTFEGLASATDTPYSVFEPRYGEFTETMKSGAFAKMEADGSDVLMLRNHDRHGPIFARRSSGTLSVREVRGSGLRADADLDPGAPSVQDLRSAIKRGDLSKMSIRFWPVRETWSDDYSTRDLLEVGVDDVSVVTEPASDATSASMRSVRVAAISRDLGKGRTVAPSVIGELRGMLESAAHDDALDPTAHRAAVLLGVIAPVTVRTLRERYEVLRAAALAEKREGKTISADTKTQIKAVLAELAKAGDTIDGAEDLLNLLITGGGSGSSTAGAAAPDDATDAVTDADQVARSAAQLARIDRECREARSDSSTSAALSSMNTWDSYEYRIGAVNDALNDAYGRNYSQIDQGCYVYSVATFADHVVFQVSDWQADTRQMYDARYTCLDPDDDGDIDEVTFGTPSPMVANTTIVPDADTDAPVLKSTDGSSPRSAEPAMSLSEIRAFAAKSREKGQQLLA